MRVNLITRRSDQGGLYECTELDEQYEATPAKVQLSQGDQEQELIVSDEVEMEDDYEDEQTYLKASTF